MAKALLLRNYQHKSNNNTITFWERYGYHNMKKNARRIIALFALAAIVVLIIAFAISAFTAAPGESGNRFMALLFCIIAIPILAWLLLFCIGRFQHKHTIAELFPEQKEENRENDL
ncbi:MAG: hypothetical protein K2G55_19160 [Lachnospiraceae bacterium]|nr:hypothetical protein [Lachnospiraceae bacterium]MDE7204977.1 hypothetical protein [Lachnospiraceae bacterium]